MRLRLTRADVVAAALLAAFVLAFGTGLGVAAARIHSGDSPHTRPLQMIIGGDTQPQSIQRDRVRLRHRP